MGEYQPFQTLLEATNHTKEITRGDFSPGEADLTDADQALIRSFNCYWDTKVYSLATQVHYLLINIFRAYQYQPDQLGDGPGLSVGGRIKEAKEWVDFIKHIKFIETIYSMTIDTVFTVPEAEAADTAQQQKQKRDNRQDIF